MNEVFNGGAVHKFKISSSGQLDEIMNSGPWYPGNGTSELPAPHGLGTDLNGYLYIGSSWNGNEGEIRKLDCDGNIFPETGANGFLIPDIGVHNMLSIKNTLYAKTFINSTTYQDNSIYAFDLCSGSAIGQFNFGTDITWAYFIDKNENMFASGDGNGGSIFKFSASDINGAEIPSFITNILNNAHPSMTTLTGGITTDPQGNIYQVVNSGFQSPAQVLKFDANGNFLTSTSVDSNENDGGWYGAIGIAYAETCDCLYTTNANTTEDCVSIFDLNLNYMGAGVGPAGPTNPSADTPLNMAKAVGVLKECCPNSVTQVIDETICGISMGDKIFLNLVFPCEGIVCGAEWEPTPDSYGFTFDECEQSITIDSEQACGTFNKIGSNPNCGGFNITYSLDILADADLQMSDDQTLCVGEEVEYLYVNTNADVIQWQKSTTSSNSGFQDISGANSQFYLPDNLTTTTYFRVVARNNGTCSSGNCTYTSQVVTVTLNENCGTLEECNLLVLPLYSQYNDNNTPNNHTDDTFTYTVKISGNGPNGWTTDNQSGNYEETVTFGPHPVGTNGIMLKVRDAFDSSCSVDVGLNVGSCTYTGSCICCGVND